MAAFRLLALLGASIFSALVLAQATPAPLSAEDIARLKQSGAAIANTARGQLPVFDSKGLVLGPDGKPVTQPAAAANLPSQADYVKGILGLGNIENIADPGRGENLGANVGAANTLDFSCAPGGTFDLMRAVIGLNVNIVGCTFTGPSTAPSVASVRAKFCTATLTGGFCGGVAAPLQTLQPGGGPMAVGDFQVSVACTAGTRQCRLSVATVAKLNTTEPTLAADAAALSATQQAEPGNSIAGTLTQAYLSDRYRDAYLGLGPSLKACVDANNQRVAAGQAPLTCDGSEAVSYNGGRTGGAGGSCVQSRTCVRKETRSVDYETSCVRTLPLTNYNCASVIPTLTCHLTKNLKTGETTNTCTPAQTAGGSLVDSTYDTAVCTTVAAPSTCVVMEWDEFWAFESQIKHAGCNAAPYPLKDSPVNSCVWGGLPPTPQDCGEWFRRTLSEDECSSNPISNPGGESTVTQLTYKEKAGCGLCVVPITKDLCHAKPNSYSNPEDTCSGINLDPSACKLTSTVPRTYDSLLGAPILTSQAEYYACHFTELTCVEWKYTSNCDADVTLGLDKLKPESLNNNGSMNQAIAHAAVIDALAQGAEANDNPVIAKVFGGADMRCRKPVGFLVGMLINDCCRTNLERPGGNRPFHLCAPQDPPDNIYRWEVKLASARRSHYEVYIGEYCSQEVKLAFIKKCIERTQTYCVFPGLLPKLIQQQGRQQLAQLTATLGGDRKSVSQTFGYYNGAGQWAPAMSANGITVVPWQWPTYCADPKQADNVLSTTPNAKECPVGLGLYYAVCEKSGGCGALPERPELGSEKWAVQALDPLTNATTAVSRYGAIGGACDPKTSTCAYTLSAWPVGVGGRAVLSQNIDFPLYLDSAQVPDDPRVVGSPRDISNLGNYVFRPWPTAGANDMKTLPATVRIDFSNNGAPWQSLDVPSVLNGDFPVPGTDVVINGRCSAVSNECNYRATGTVTVTAKTWGTAQAPDCTGFDMPQLSALNFAAMDLSEWIATIVNKVQSPNVTALAAAAASQAQNFHSVMSGSGSVAASNPSRVQTAKIVPREDYGPFVATLTVAPNWPVVYEPGDPRNDDPISMVTVDWGDCTAKTYAPLISVTANGQTGKAFQAQHTYPQPDQVACAGAGEHNFEHTVKLDIVSAKTGNHTMTMKVVNVWSNFQGTVGKNEGPGGNTANVANAPAPGSGLPSVGGGGIPPPVGLEFCSAFPGTITGTLAFDGTSLSSQGLGGFGPDAAFVGKFTVPAGYPSSASVLGFGKSTGVGSPVANKTMSLSKYACDFRNADPSGANGPIGYAYGQAPSISFTVGTALGSTPRLQPGETYYFNVINRSPGNPNSTCAGVCDATLLVSPPK